MSATKEKILQTALHLFARDGYEAVSVRQIADLLGLTKGALYKHYKNKKDIFKSIVHRMYQIDYARAREYEVPEEVFEKSPQTYRTTTVDQIRTFSKAQFRFWTEDEFACDFRKMLTLEQYRNPEIAELYQTCLVTGPVSYMKDLFAEMMKQGIWKQADAKQLALEFYAPLFLLISISDGSSDNNELAELFSAHLERFIQTNIAEQT